MSYPKFLLNENEGNVENNTMLNYLIYKPGLSNTQNKLENSFHKVMRYMFRVFDTLFTILISSFIVSNFHQNS